MRDKWKGQEADSQKAAFYHLSFAFKIAKPWIYLQAEGMIQMAPLGNAGSYK